MSAVWDVYCFNIQLKKKRPVGNVVINHSHPETGTCLRPHTRTHPSSDYGSIRINIEQTPRDF